MNLKTINLGEGKQINLGGVYKTNNGHTITINNIWTDKYSDTISYRLEDGRHGDAGFNDAFYMIDWAR